MPWCVHVVTRSLEFAWQADRQAGRQGIHQCLMGSSTNIKWLFRSNDSVQIMYGVQQWVSEPKTLYYDYYYYCSFLFYRHAARPYVNSISSDRRRSNEKKIEPASIRGARNIRARQPIPSHHPIYIRKLCANYEIRIGKRNNNNNKILEWKVKWKWKTRKIHELKIICLITRREEKHEIFATTKTQSIWKFVVYMNTAIENGVNTSCRCHSSQTNHSFSHPHTLGSGKWRSREK